MAALHTKTYDFADRNTGWNYYTHIELFFQIVFVLKITSNCSIEYRLIEAGVLVKVLIELLPNDRSKYIS